MKKFRKNRSNSKSKLSSIQKIILGVIILTIVSVIIAVIFAFSAQPENQTKSKLEALAQNYYENYLYENILGSENFSGNIGETLSKYTETGLSSIPLRTLLLHNTGQSSSETSIIKQHCDENRTSIKFYPDPPFTKTSYHIEYKYSCDF